MSRTQTICVTPKSRPALTITPLLFQHAALNQPPSFSESLSGLIERVTYFNEENGYAGLHAWGWSFLNVSLLNSQLVLEDHYGVPANALAGTAVNEWLDAKLEACQKYLRIIREVREGAPRKSGQTRFEVLGRGAGRPNCLDKRTDCGKFPK